MDQKRILHMIEREKRYIELLADKDLSCHGHWDMGYHQGRLSVLENMEGMSESWIPVAERMPEPVTRVLATIRHHEWIADPGHEDQTRHPEWTESCEARYLGGKEWEYADREGEYEVTSAFSNPGRLGVELSFMFDEVVAWMKLPEPYRPED